jgi:hypothetical protein
MCAWWPQCGDCNLWFVDTSLALVSGLSEERRCVSLSSCSPPWLIHPLSLSLSLPSLLSGCHPHPHVLSTRQVPSPRCSSCPSDSRCQGSLRSGGESLLLLDHLPLHLLWLYSSFSSPHSLLSLVRLLHLSSTNSKQQSKSFKTPMRSSSQSHPASLLSSLRRIRRFRLCPLTWLNSNSSLSQRC